VDTEGYREAFARITQDADYLKNMDWGAPRPGHPEGTVRAHVQELEANLARLRSFVSGEECEKLRLLIHTHDSFKAEAAEGVAIADPRSHASLARAFLARFIDDEDLQQMVQCHDEPYALWRAEVHGHWKPQTQKRYDALLERIYDWHLFRVFLVIDACTAGKERDSIRWFLDKVAPLLPVGPHEEMVDRLSE